MRLSNPLHCPPVDSESVRPARNGSAIVRNLAINHGRIATGVEVRSADETLSDNPAEAKVAGRALAFFDRAFEELEGGKR